MACPDLYRDFFTFTTSKIQGDQKVSVHLTITVQSSVAQRLFNHPVVTKANIAAVYKNIATYVDLVQVDI